MPGETKRIFITIFSNRTSAIGVENVLAAQLTDEFISLGPKGVLASDRQDADAELSGVISTVQVYTVSLRTQSSSATRRVVITVAARLTGSNGKILWRADTLSASRPFTVEADRLATDVNKRAAIASATRLLAETIYNRMTSGF
ncbi:MAG: LPS assembly lipoprotein LptE [Deltaproteobacteria bacterium]|nr:LPS assembly lipoprotein LptE [Deltaproteobacteria bacterium]